MTLTEFLTARLDDDEAVARQAASIRAQTDFRPGHEPELPDMGIWANDDVLGGATVCIGPERVLAEVEAKRRIVADSRLVIEKYAGGTFLDYAHNVLRLLALPYASHPDFDETWRP